MFLYVRVGISRVSVRAAATWNTQSSGGMHVRVVQL